MLSASIDREIVMICVRLAVKIFGTIMFFGLVHDEEYNDARNALAGYSPRRIDVRPHCSPTLLAARTACR